MNLQSRKNAFTVYLLRLDNIILWGFALLKQIIIKQVRSVVGGGKPPTPFYTHLVIQAYLVQILSHGLCTLILCR